MFQKKSLGQNFLKNSHIVDKIVATGNVTPNDFVLEIGPGKGVLTRALLNTGCTVYAVEKDDRLIPILTEMFAKEITNGKLVLIHGDIELMSVEELIITKKPYKLIANIPYYITGLIMRKFLESDFQPTDAVLLVQKEVADRIVAHDKKESLLSISIKIFGEPTKVGIVKAGNFEPVPKVDSAILAIHNISKKEFESNNVNEKRFFEVVRAGFSSKRKTLLNNLSPFTSKEKLKDLFKKIDIPEQGRAEDLTIKNWIEITKEI